MRSLTPPLFEEPTVWAEIDASLACFGIGSPQLFYARPQLTACRIYWGIFRHNPSHISRHTAINALIHPVTFPTVAITVLGIFWDILPDKFLRFLSDLMVEVHEFGNQVPQHGFDANFDWTCQFHAYFLNAFQLHLIEGEMRMNECIPSYTIHGHDDWSEKIQLHLMVLQLGFDLLSMISGASQPTSLHMGCMASLKWDRHSVHACIACTLWLISFQRKLRH